MSEPVKVVIVDDHPLFRQGLRQVIEGDPRLAFAGEAGTVAEAWSCLRDTNPDIVVLDVNLPDGSGLELARTIQDKKEHFRVVILTMHKEEETFNRAMDFGVMGFMLKENAVEDMVDCLLSVSRGTHYISPSISGYLVRRRHRSDTLERERPGLDSLTKAELRILRLIAEKKTSKEIAAELYISPRTVEAHRSNICAKLELRGTNSLLQFALENRGLV